MGLYIHIPFCRKRCKFCYFRVYTNQNAQAIENYVQALEQEFELLASSRPSPDERCGLRTSAAGRPLTLSSKQLRSLHDRLSEYLSWETAEEVTFECEPGTLSLEKVEDAQGHRRHARVAWGSRTSTTKFWRPTAGPICRPKSSAHTTGCSRSASRRSTST